MREKEKREGEDTTLSTKNDTKNTCFPVKEDDKSLPKFLGDYFIYLCIYIRVDNLATE